MSDEPVALAAIVAIVAMETIGLRIPERAAKGKLRRLFLNIFSRVDILLRLKRLPRKLEPDYGSGRC